MKKFALFVLVVTLSICLGIWVGGYTGSESPSSEIQTASWSLTDQARSEIPELHDASEEDVQRYVSTVFRANLVYRGNADDKEALVRETEGLLKLADNNVAQTKDAKVHRLYDEFRAAMHENLKVLKTQ
ncbi:MAG: hypothetical protein WD898_02335 [Candidatus Paceibacterota bacterium]